LNIYTIFLSAHNETEKENQQALFHFVWMPPFADSSKPSLFLTDPHSVPLVSRRLLHEMLASRQKDGANRVLGLASGKEPSRFGKSPLTV